jgi:transcriptional regulator with XRE-family HTH domain
VTIGEKIKFLRKNSNITQEELANKLNLTTPSAVSKYESNMVPVPQDTIIKLARIFNVSTDYLLGLDILDEPLQIASSMKNGIDLTGMDEHDKEVIRSIVESLRKRK